jgi:hypothetical protein
MNNISTLQSYPVPSKVIIDVDDYLIKLNSSINQPDIPTIDIDALLDFIVDSISHYPSAENELWELSHNLVKNELLGSRTNSRQTGWDSGDQSESLKGLEAVAINSVRIGHALCRYLKHHGLFVDQYLNFEYGGVIDERSLLFRRRRR